MTTAPSLPAHLQGGNADSFSVGIESLTLIGDSTIRLPSPGVTAIVGANNAGKSTLLREIHAALTHGVGQDRNQFRLLSAPRLARTGSGVDAVAWLARHAVHVSHPDGSISFVGQFQGQALDGLRVARLWQELAMHPDRLSELHQFFAHYMNAEARLGGTAPQGRRQNFTDPPLQPLHYLEDDPDLLKKVQALSERLFRQTLTLDRLSNAVRLRVGSTGITSPPIDMVTREYQNALGQLPDLFEQGDGMRSLLGQLLPIVTATRPIFIIDEPEAFLHPPQAAALGTVLGELAAENRLQIIVATHDRNLLTGLLASPADISVVRLDRQANSTRASQLDSDNLRTLWSDPVLRYSNVLDGLFHRLVVLAEADQDCRFYAAALDHANSVTPLALAPTDVLFVPSGGKDGLRKFATALRAVRVPVVASPDLDILNEKNKIKALVEAFHGDWTTFEADYNTATAPFRQPRAPRTVANVCRAITGALKDNMTEIYGPKHRELVQGELYVASPFSELKSKGMSAFENGRARAAAERLITALEAIGIVPVQVGELESFAPLLDVRKGPAWLSAALEAGAHKDHDAQEHLQRIMRAHAPTL